MSYVRTEEEARMSVRALIKYILEEDPDPSFAEERILVMIKEAYDYGMLDWASSKEKRYKNIVQNDFRRIS